MSGTTRDAPPTEHDHGFRCVVFTRVPRGSLNYSVLTILPREKIPIILPSISYSTAAKATQTPPTLDMSLALHVV